MQHSEARSAFTAFAQLPDVTDLSAHRRPIYELGGWMLCHIVSLKAMEGCVQDTLDSETAGSDTTSSGVDVDAVSDAIML